MNETISAFLEELDPFWHFLAPVIVSGFLGCLLGVFLSCLFCRPKAAPAVPVQEKAVPPTNMAPPAPSPVSPVQAAARPPEVQAGQAHVGKLGLLYHVKPQDADDLTLITGLNSATAVRLRDLGIYRFDQISQWTPDIVDSIRLSILGANQIIEEKWVDQAKRLASQKLEGKPRIA
jgi:predicted flap endonuclease-1-like 5' DNA nuclease